MDNEALIELDGVDVHREEGSERLLGAVNWRIGRGEFWAVSGLPGSGKSSLLLTAAGLNRPGAGTLRVFGRDLAQATEEEQVDWRRRIGFVYEHGGRLFSHLSVYENLALPLLYHTEADEAECLPRVEQALHRAELTGCALLKPSRVSVRQQRRASLMRALIVTTEALFLDSPLSGLGARDARWWTDYLRELKTQGLTIVVGDDEYRPWLGLADHFGLIEGEQFRVITEAAAREWN